MDYDEAVTQAPPPHCQPTLLRSTMTLCICLEMGPFQLSEASLLPLGGKLGVDLSVFAHSHPPSLLPALLPPVPCAGPLLVASLERGALPCSSSTALFWLRRPEIRLFCRGCSRRFSLLLVFSWALQGCTSHTHCPPCPHGPCPSLHAHRLV